MAARVALALLSSLTGLASSIPVNGDTDPPKYVTGYPICNVTGFTETPGNYTQWTYKEKGITLDQCIKACRHTKGCKSLSWAARYTGCWFLDQPVEKTQLILDPTSNFAHYDKRCPICTQHESESDENPENESDSDSDVDALN